MKRRTRPSSGCALRVAGNEMLKRSGPAAVVRGVTAQPETESSKARNEPVIVRMRGVYPDGAFRRVRKDPPYAGRGGAHLLITTDPESTRLNSPHIPISYAGLFL